MDGGGDGVSFAAVLGCRWVIGGGGGRRRVRGIGTIGEIHGGIDRDAEGAEDGGLKCLEGGDQFMDAMCVCLVRGYEFIHSFSGGGLVISMLKDNRVVLLADKVHLVFKFLAELIF